MFALSTYMYRIEHSIHETVCRRKCCQNNLWNSWQRFKTILNSLVQVVGTAGYAAPEYIQTGHLTVKSDVWSFGIVMLEVLTGRKVMDRNRPKNEQRLVEWAKPFINDHHKLFQVVDPLLNGKYPVRQAQKFAQLAYHCLHKFPKHRPKMSEVVEKLKIVQEKTSQWESPALHSPSSLSVSQEFPRSSRDSPRGLTLGSLPSVRSGKVSKFSPRIRDSGSGADISRHISNLSLEGHSTNSVGTSGGEPKSLDPPAEKSKLVAPVVEEPKPVDTIAEKPKLLLTTEEEPKLVVEEPKLLSATEDKPEPVKASAEKPKLLDTTGEEPKLVDTSPKLVDAEAVEPKVVDTAADIPKPVDTVVEDPKLVHTLVEERKLGDKVAEEPKLGDAVVAKLGDTVVEKPKLVGLSKEDASSETVKRRSWGSDRLARMSRESGRFTWIPKLYGSLSS